MAKLKAGLIGLGMMGRHHARNLQSLEGVELVAVADAYGDPHGAAPNHTILESVDDIIRQGVDYCVVAVPTEFHYQIGMQLAEAGIHALIEKPLSHSAATAFALAEAFDQAGLVGAVGHIERFNPSLQQLRKRLDEGMLGEIFQVATSRQGPFPARIADVGVVKDLASHDIDLTSWLTRQMYVDVSATTTHRSGRPHEDMVSITARLDKGTVVNHLVNWLTPAKERRTVVIGENGMFVADTLTADLTFYANASVKTLWSDISHFRGVAEGDVTRFAFSKQEPLKLEHENMRDAVLGKTADIVTMKQGAAVVRTCEAVLEAAGRRSTIELSHIQEGSWE